MEQLTIKIEVPRKVALIAAVPDFGSTTYQPTSDQLSELDQAERAWLDGKLNNTFRLDAPTVGWAAVLEAIRHYRQKELDDREKAIVEALAKPDEKWLGESYGRPALTIPGAWGTTIDQDDRIKARVEALRPELERRQVDHDRQVAERDAQREADRERRAKADEERKAAEEKAIEEIKAWAEQQEEDALSRAAREDYAVTNAVLQYIAESLAGDLGGEVDRQGSVRWKHWDFEERSAPTESAFSSWDEAKEAVEALDKPACVEVTLERIARVTETVGEEYDEHVEHYTAVLVMVSAPVEGANQRAVIVKVDED